MLRVNEANEGFNKMNEVVHQVNERMNGSLKWKREKPKIIQGVSSKFCDNAAKMVKKMQKIQISNIYLK